MSKKLAVLLSGNGTTLENIFKKIEEGFIPAAVELVIGTKQDAYGLVRAKNRNVPTKVINPRKCESTFDFSRQLTETIDEYDVDLIILAGFMFLYILPDKYKHKVVNIHPSLIPAFCGKGCYGHRVAQAALDRGVKLTGCTAHFVDNIYDNGPIIMQKPVEVRDGDTADILESRVQEAEKDIYPEVIRLFCEDKLKIEDNRVLILD